MRLRARGFLLFSFAFSSALSSAVLETPSRTLNGKATLETVKQNAENKNGGLKTSNADHGVEKRSPELFPQGFIGEEDKKKEVLDTLRDDLEKRTRLGFTGMRGKKEFTAGDYCARNLRASLERALTLNKRFPRDFNDLLGGKRATMAFHGMRGKKSEDYDNEIELEGFPSQEFLISSGLLDDPVRILEEKPEEDSSEEIQKRSPYSFQGMRGKKESAYDLKRAMGFLGMRGKKATEVWDADVNYKRVPQTSFFGMKGKKAQSSGFFGMRGKKASPSAFFGIKGKRDPVDDLQDFSLLNQSKEPEPRNRFRRGITWLSNSKKAKNTFFGIRGKKSTQGRLESSFADSYE